MARKTDAGHMQQFGCRVVSRSAQLRDGSWSVFKGGPKVNDKDKGMSREAYVNQCKSPKLCPGSLQPQIIVGKPSRSMT